MTPKAISRYLNTPQLPRCQVEAAEVKCPCGRDPHRQLAVATATVAPPVGFLGATRPPTRSSYGAGAPIPVSALDTWGPRALLPSPNPPMDRGWTA